MMPYCYSIFFITICDEEPTHCDMYNTNSTVKGGTLSNLLNYSLFGAGYV